jgi:hypothetical protein
LNRSPCLDHPAGLSPVRFGQGGPRAADRSTSSIGTLLPPVIERRLRNPCLAADLPDCRAFFCPPQNEGYLRFRKLRFIVLARPTAPNRCAAKLEFSSNHRFKNREAGHCFGPRRIAEASESASSAVYHRLRCVVVLPTPIFDLPDRVIQINKPVQTEAFEASGGVAHHLGFARTRPLRRHYTSKGFDRMLSVPSTTATLDLNARLDEPSHNPLVIASTVPQIRRIDETAKLTV